MTDLDPNEDQVIQRLDEALVAEARRHPLADDFSSSVAASLPERPARTFWSPATVPAAAATVVVVLAAVVLVVAISRHLIAPGRGGSSLPSTNGPSQSQAAVLAHYDHDGISFDYPAAWRVIEANINARHYQWIPVVIGTGDWQLNCQAIPPNGNSLGGVTCGRDIFTVDAGEIVVEIYAWQGPGGPIVTPPPTATQLPSGLPATRQDGADTSVWQVYVPDWVSPLVIEARFDPDTADSAKAAVQALVESLAIAKVD
jgi:hypothetical protein